MADERGDEGVEEVGGGEACVVGAREDLREEADANGAVEEADDEEGDQEDHGGDDPEKHGRGAQPPGEVSQTDARAADVHADGEVAWAMTLPYISWVRVCALCAFLSDASVLDGVSSRWNTLFPDAVEDVIRASCRTPVSQAVRSTSQVVEVSFLKGLGAAVVVRDI